jgi:hypothetical protein
MLPHAYLIEVVTWGLALVALALSLWSLRESYRDWWAERDVPTSGMAMVNTRWDMRVEIVQLGQVVMLVVLGLRGVYTIPPEAVGQFMSPEQLNTGRVVFMVFTLLKALGRFLECEKRRRTAAAYRAEFVGMPPRKGGGSKTWR